MVTRSRWIDIRVNFWSDYPGRASSYELWDTWSRSCRRQSLSKLLREQRNGGRPSDRYLGVGLSANLGSPPDRVKSTRSLVLQLDNTLPHIGTHKSSTPTCTLGCLVDTLGRNGPQSNHPNAIIVPVIDGHINREEAKCQKSS